MDRKTLPFPKCAENHVGALGYFIRAYNAGRAQVHYPIITRDEISILSPRSFRIVIGLKFLRPPGGSESGLGILYHSYHCHHFAAVGVELDNGERWGTIGTLPDVRTARSVTRQLPGDARRVFPAPVSGQAGARD
ncbi:hypothetical protein [Fimbriiglobus ruber]|uniref:Uncharacterized protein n=1 Tax=Fimbriiglobus ruber TaxID=1908690 RepID=A0A225DZI2_9BACT|nr:hypothetical protein [Fimbriiglobus ruber]OWK44984.1 hypothetical protein FRUB_01315 [Fimbriiglobus ruber]